MKGLLNQIRVLQESVNTLKRTKTTKHHDLKKSLTELKSKKEQLRAAKVKRGIDGTRSTR